MRTLLLLAAVLLVSCKNADPQLLILRPREPQRVKDCNVYLEQVRDDHERGKPVRRTFLQVVCGVPESTLEGKWWWGDGLKPPGFSLEIGDCMPVGDTYYCLEDVSDYESATFRPTYLKPEHPKGNLWRIR